MNNRKAKVLRALFNADLKFPTGDSRNRTVWKNFKKEYSSYPWNQRNLFISGQKRLLGVETVSGNG